MCEFTGVCVIVLFIQIQCIFIIRRPCFIFRHPPSTKKDRIVFLQPFSNIVWILLGLCGIFTICLLWLLTSVERRLEAVGVVKQLGKFYLLW